MFKQPDGHHVGGCEVGTGPCGGWDIQNPSCSPGAFNTVTGNCDFANENPKNPPDACPSTPNPVVVANGNKHFNIDDFNSTPLNFRRHYNSSTAYYTAPFGSLFNGIKPMGYPWTHNYYYGLTVTSASEVKLTRNNGQQFIFNFVAGVWQPDADVNFKLAEIKDTGGMRTGWKVVTPNSEIETYSAIGDLLSILDSNGFTQTLTYSCTTVSATCPVATPATVAPYPGLLIKVSDNFGKSLNFTYTSSGQMATMTDPATNVFSYGYDGSGNLKTVTYPDGTPSVSTDNPVITYVYGSDTGETANTAGVSQPHAITGVIDENGARTMTYQYDANGRAFNEFSTGNIDKYTLAYAPDGSYTNVTDPLGSVRKTNFTTVLGVVKATGTDQPAGSGCAAASSALTYDANGNVASRTDFNGHKACYAYDLSRNLESARVEGLASVADCAANLSASTLTLPLRKISTQWHPDWRLPVREAAPKLITTSVYNGQPDPTNGNSVLNCAPTTALVDGKPLAVLCKKVEQATTDQTGVAGFAATATGAPRIWTYTYNNYGQVLTEDGPRTDVADKITTTYYADNDPALGNRGNLKTVTNALGQTTTYNSYDGNGRLLQVTAPNGVATALAYYPRGWLKSLTVTGGTNVETTSYTYDPTGLLKTVTSPEGSVLAYGYDTAHRLTSITDSVGNKVTYALDNMGNRTSEKATDPANVLRRNITRVYDALNRLQTVTGAAQ